MPPGGEFISVSAGNNHTCGVRTDGSVACWGSNTRIGEFDWRSLSARGPIRLRQRREPPHLRDKGRRLRRLLGRRL